MRVWSMRSSANAGCAMLTRRRAAVRRTDAINIRQDAASPKGALRFCCDMFHEAHVLIVSLRVELAFAAFPACCRGEFRARSALLLCAYVRRVSIQLIAQSCIALAARRRLHVLKQGPFPARWPSYACGQAATASAAQALRRPTPAESITNTA